MSAREFAHGVMRVVRGMSGLDAYDRYVAHHRHAHPGQPVLDRGSFYRAKWDDETRNPRARCC
ncbi:YbdD/YjiX family protein [Luteococcus sp. Sow4_B9]|uniref:YbdD/YjiX family protein n=1 Tax=Luteococcus sp. Sow4_B9 TaxID=3438792 RepID=UPI003F9C0712